MEPNESRENYLEAILMVKEKQGYVRAVDIANHLKISKPSVTYATKKLKDAELIDFDNNGMIVFTTKGKTIAEDTYLKHKTLTSFFEHIGVSSKQAKIDACKVEHDLSKETFDAILKFVKHLK